MLLSYFSERVAVCTYVCQFANLFWLNFKALNWHHLSLLGHINHTAATSFQFAGFFRPPECGVVHFRSPHSLQVSIEVNPLVLFLVCLHLFVFLLRLILWNPSARCSLSLLPLCCFSLALLSTKATQLRPYLHQRPVLLLGPRSMLASFRERK